VSEIICMAQKIERTMRPTWASVPGSAGPEEQKAREPKLKT